MSGQRPITPLPPPSVPHDYITKGLGGSTVTTKPPPAVQDVIETGAESDWLIGYIVFAMAVMFALGFAFGMYVA